jgi:hypothetical protein
MDGIAILCHLAVIPCLHYFCSLFKSSLEELKNLVMIRGELKDEIWAKVTQLLDRIVADWNQGQEERRQKAEEEQSLFVTK